MCFYVKYAFEWQGPQGAGAESAQAKLGSLHTKRFKGDHTALCGLPCELLQTAC